MNNNTKLRKVELRNELLGIILNISDKQEKSQSIVRRLLLLPEISHSKSILLFSPGQNEVDISRLFSIFQKEKKKVFLPSVNNLIITQITPKTKLISRSFGILEPSIRAQENPERIDLAVIPGLGFDRNGGRLGHGIGWYDKLFSKVKVKCKIGVCFNEQIISEVPLESHDKMMNIIITEKEIIYPF